MNKPEIIKADNDYPCADCGGHGVPRTKSGTHYIECHKCKARTRFCLNGESEARYEWASMNASKNAVKSDFSGQVIPEDDEKIFTLSIDAAGAIKIIGEELVDPEPINEDRFTFTAKIIGDWPAFGSPECKELIEGAPIQCIECLKPIEESLPVKTCEGCLEPIHYLCECSNCNL